ncbi:protein FAM170B [Drosophila tropicalis]|uniref:protein FAM170B n=1 Tax=Drosophila tropicalis TaxID=46794 RepID=UPI0035ABC350
MKTFFVTLAIGFCMVAGDVSHLPSSYLPPPKPEHAVSMSIEQQELRELPEQVEYMREMDNSQMDMDTNMMAGGMPMPSSLLTPPAPVESEADSHLPLPTRYLPPAQQMNQAPGQEEESFAQAAAPTEPEPLMQPEAEQQQMPMDYMQYLPPAPVDGSAGQQQLTYQQYQKQLQQQQQQQQEQQPLDQQEYQMPYILDVVQQPMAPSDAETLAYEEPQPAHELRNDGYHYKSQTAEEEQRLRH